MKKILLCFLLLAIGVGAFAALVWNRETVDETLIMYGIDPANSFWTRGILKAIATVLVGLPIAALLWTIVGLGRDEGSTDNHGFTVLRPMAGVRYVISPLAFALSAGFVFAAFDSDQALFAAFMLTFAAGFLFGGFWIFFAKVKYDGTAVYVPKYTGVVQRYEWIDLQTIEPNKDAQEFHLIFSGNRKARVSYYFAGVQGLIELAWSKINARAA